MPHDAPNVRAFLICDHVWRDPNNGKWHICGVFSHVRSPAEPITIGTLALYLNMRGMNGTYKLAIEIVEAGSEQLVGGIEAEPDVVVSDPLFVFEFGLQFPPIQFNKFGHYLFRLKANGQALQDISFYIERV